MQSRKFCDTFSWKIHFFQSIADIVKPFLWEVFETSYFNLVWIFLPIVAQFVQFLAQNWSKNNHFFLKNVKYLIKVSEFYSYLIHFTFDLGYELSFRREKYDLQDGPKFRPIGRLDKKKSTFWPSLLKFLVLILIIRD